MHADKRIQVSVYQKAKQGNYCCGDSYYFQENDSEFVCALADGLGSGPYAKESSQAVMDIIEQNTHVSVNRLIQLCNKALVGKRGVVLGVLKIDFLNKKYTFTSIGNIGVMTISSNLEKKRNIPNSGYLGGCQRPIKVQRDDLKEGMVFIMFSDGVRTSELSEKYFFGKDVHQITETFASTGGTKQSDDTTLIAMKYS
ncbi:SpoIIE family protein phosphatase [Aquibacillus albus]|uniref:Negative regulator of sigma-B (Phosphoserine phosphatase) n=1 Tax=Aquibacillus albus TaxID=1168171 RepID=A0ABS2MYU7_9BACI|nr:SpoIIE family protein phosphatase [Aquibacillus albus]MBM7571071.1 negative regulator of sigma-B (phosphoserine phosphatase) [Aquibacillus albus]